MQLEKHENKSYKMIFGKQLTQKKAHISLWHRILTCPLWSVLGTNTWMGVPVVTPAVIFFFIKQSIYKIERNKVFASFYTTEQ